MIIILVWRNFCDDVGDDDDNDDDDDDGDNKLFLWNGWPTKGVIKYSQPGPLS